MLHLGHQSRMSCSDNILEKQKKEHIFILKLVRQCCGFIFTFYSFRCILVSLKHVSIFFFHVFLLYAFEVPVVIFNAMATCSQPFLDPLVPLS